MSCLGSVLAGSRPSPSMLWEPAWRPSAAWMDRPRGEDMQGPPPARLLSSPLSVINIGLPGFADELAGLQVPVVHVDWSSPAGGDPELAAVLSRLAADPAV